MIDYIPLEKMQVIFLFFQKMNRLDLIQQIILNYKLSKFEDTQQLLSICLEFNLFKACVFVSTIGNADFLTPLNRFVNLYRSKRA